MVPTVTSTCPCKLAQRSRLAELSEEEQTRYAHEQGFARVQDVLVHIFAWWERFMQWTPTLLSGHPAPPVNVDELNAEAVAHYQQWTRAAVEEKFTATLTAFERFLLDLPETALEHERLYLRLRIGTIYHYESHRLPNGPEL